MWKRIRLYLLVAGISVIATFSATYFIAQGASAKRFERVSNDLAVSQSLVSQLNLRLDAATSGEQRLEVTTGRLASDNSRADADRAVIEAGLGRVQSNLSTAGGQVDSVIEGLEQVKDLIRSLP